MTLSRTLGTAFAALVIFLFVTDPKDSLAMEDDALAHAKELMRETPVIDGHNDLPLTIRLLKDTPGDVAAHDLRKRTAHDTDIPRLREGMVGGQFWSVYIEPAVAKEEGYAKWQLEQIDIAHRIIEQYPDVFELALTADDVERSFSDGKIASLLGIEGLYGIENSLGALRAYYRLGVRYATLTHNITHDWVDSATDAPRHGGLSGFGEEVVREMNRLGMLVDISHVSPDAMNDVLDVSEAPVIFSHSSARAITDHVRNVPDAVLARMKDNGGVVMVNFIPPLISEERRMYEVDFFKRMEGKPYSEEPAFRAAYIAERGEPPVVTLAQVADHFDHVRRVAGADHVGIGADYYGSLDMPEGMQDVTSYPRLIAELIRRGWSDDDLRKLLSGNILRAMRGAEAVAERLQRERTASTRIFEPEK